MLGYIKRGAQRLINGATGPLRGSVSGALCVQDAHAKYQEAVLSGNVWIGSVASGSPITPAVGLSAAAPILTLYNPINSPVNLVLWTFCFLPTTAQAVQTGYSLAYNMPTLTGVTRGPSSVTNANYTNAIIGLGMGGSATAVQNSGAWGQAYAAATLSVAPVAFRYPFFLEFNSATAVNVSIFTAVFVDNIDGSVVVPPGIAISVQATAATPGVAAFSWEEVPISN